jgi:hypothetical protein
MAAGEWRERYANMSGWLEVDGEMAKVACYFLDVIMIAGRLTQIIIAGCESPQMQLPASSI